MNATSENPAASIVIPTHNRRDLLPHAVESCLNQTWENCEILIVDDGSTDGTDVLVADMTVSAWPRDRLHYFKQTNRGASAARNHGLQLAQGSYVQFLDSDDLLDHSKIARQIELLETPKNYDAACCYCYGTMGEHGLDSAIAPAARIGFQTENPRDLIRELCSRRVHGMQTSAPLWRRNHLMKHAGWREDISLGDDLEYHIRLLADANKVCFIDEELFFVREHPGSRLSADQMSAASLASLVRTRQSIFGTLQQSGLWDAQTQRAFLGAMRTIYANALQLGNRATIRDLENWAWTLADSPKRNIQFQALILLRRILGRHFLLGTHQLISKIRPT